MKVSLSKFNLLKDMKKEPQKKNEFFGFDNLAPLKKDVVSFGRNIENEIVSTEQSEIPEETRKIRAKVRENLSEEKMKFEQKKKLEFQ